MQSYPERMSRGPATTNCYAHLWINKRWPKWTKSCSSIPIECTSLGILFSLRNQRTANHGWSMLNWGAPSCRHGRLHVAAILLKSGVQPTRHILEMNNNDTSKSSEGRNLPSSFRAVCRSLHEVDK